MTIYMVGNSAVKGDSSPLWLKSHIIKAFPDAIVIECDPAESFIPEEGSIIIDTVKGIRKPRIFKNLSDFTSDKSISGHDYGLYLNLKLLIKLGKIGRPTILGVPLISEPEKYLKQIMKLVSDSALKK